MLKPPRFNAYYPLADISKIDVATWKLELGGLIADKRPLTAPQIYAMPEQEIIIRHVCVEGWDYIGQWSGVNLRRFLETVGADLTAKYVAFRCNDDYYGSIDMATALHPQTILATRYAKDYLGDPFGYPLRLRTATKLGFKNPKWITAHRGDQQLSGRLLGGSRLQLVRRAVTHNPGGPGDRTPSHASARRCLSFLMSAVLRRHAPRCRAWEHGHRRAMAEAETRHLRTRTDVRRSAWMAAAQTGDHAAYEALLRDCVGVIARAARRQGVPADRVDDVVQDTLLTVHRARQTYDPARSFTAWLRVIAERRAIDLMRRTGRHATREVHAPIAYELHADDSAAPARAADGTAASGGLAAAVADLPMRQREAVQLLVLQEQSLAETAAATGRSKGSLKVNLHRALKNLRARLSQEG